MAARRELFISFQHDDVMKARALRLMSANPNHRMSFVERSFIDPLKDKTDAQIRDAIRTEIQQSDAVMVLVGDKTHGSTWVAEEVQMADNMDKGITAMYAPGKEDAPVPKCLEERGIHVHSWSPNDLNQHVDNAIREAADAKGQREAPKNTGDC